ncbi:FxLD family lanthipeptide [Longispora sp. K20-0274]
MNDLLVTDNQPFELDLRIATEGPVVAALLSSTDDGCDTKQGSDC